jgi:RND family efflux transporter MFP subunit
MSTNTVQQPARSSGTRWVVPIVLLLIVGAVGTWYYVSTRPHPTQVVERDIVGLVPLNGEVIAPPSARADVFTPYHAPVDKVEVSIGQVVHRGDVLVKLSFPDIQQAAEQARQAVKTAETAYANARRQFDASITAARRDAVSARASEASPPSGGTINPPPVDQEGSNPGPTPDQLAAQRAAAAQALAQAQADRDAALVPYQQQLDAARDFYQQVKSGAKLALIRAPIKGTVMALNAQPGREVGTDPKVPVATIVNLDALKVQAKLAPDQVGVAKLGTPVLITFKDIPNKQFEGKVERITTQVVSKLAGLRKEEQYVALIDFQNDSGLAKPGMKPVVALKTGEVKNALAVPNEAIGTDPSGRPVVRALRNGTWEPVVVATGISDRQYTEIKEGLKPGETVQVVPNPLAAATRMRR